MTSFNTHTTCSKTVTLESGIDVELNLPVTPDSIMEYKEYLMHQDGRKLILGYLTHESDCENPSDSDEYFGHIYTARRHSPDLSKFFDALGLDSHGNPDLGAVEDDIEDECKRRLRLMAKGGYQGLNIALKIDGDFDDEERKEDETMIEFVLRLVDDGTVDLEDYFDFDTINEELWREAVKTGKVGNKYAVSLDVYEHSMVKYSVTGSGPQCRFDTARGGAVWVPSDLAKEEIQRRGPVYQKGKIITSNLRTKYQYNIRTYKEFGVFDEIVYPNFASWGEAFEYLKALPTPAYVQSLEDGEYDAARELASAAADTYTDWCNGACYTTVVATFELPEELEDGDEIDYQDWDSCGGYIGDDDAMSALQEAFDEQK